MDGYDEMYFRYIVNSVQDLYNSSDLRIEYIIPNLLRGVGYKWKYLDDNLGENHSNSLALT